MVDPRQPAPSSAAPPLEIRERHPTDPRWRADLLAQSTHGRLIAESDPPAAPDAASDAAAGELLDARCAELTRELLGDFAPALLLLPATERARVRALLAYSRTLLAGAAGLGLDGERLAQVNRWEAALERALDSRVEGLPPICVRMAREHARRRWPADALDELTACARRRALRPRPATVADAEVEARSLARAVGGALLEARLNAEVNGFGGALVRLCAVQHLGAAMAGGRCPLPEDEWPHQAAPAARAVAAAPAAAPPALIAAVQRECARLRPRLLRAPRGLVELPAAYRRAGVFALLAALRLLSDVEEAGAGLLAAAPHLGTATRIGLLVRARWFGPRIGVEDS